MKHKSALIMVGLIIFGSGSLSGELTPTNTIPATLRWTVTTNWSSAGQSRTLLGWSGIGDDPNVTTFYEHGLISSNLLAVIIWKGEPKIVVLESIPVTYTFRSYRVKRERSYLPDIPWMVGTNLSINK